MANPSQRFRSDSTYSHDSLMRDLRELDEEVQAAANKPGVKGDKGDPGENGVDGINGVDGVSVKGDKGDKGEKGDTAKVGLAEFFNLMYLDAIENDGFNGTLEEYTASFRFAIRHAHDQMNDLGYVNEDYNLASAGPEDYNI